MLLLLGVSAVGAARESNDTAKCLDNLKRWGAGISMYAEANGGYLIPQQVAAVPGAVISMDIWCGLSSSLRLMLAPEATDVQWRSGASITGCPAGMPNWAKRQYSYAHNSTVMGTFSQPNQLVKVGRPANKIAFADGTMYNFSVGSYEAETFRRLAVRHENGEAVNFVFVDGHGKTWQGREVASMKAPAEIRAMFRR